MSKIKFQWLQLTEETNALDYLNQADYYIQLANEKKIAWKWVILCLHGALYGFAVCAAQGTNPSRLIEVVKNGKNKGREKLFSFNKVLEKCQDPNWMLITGISKYLQLTDSQKKSIRRLKDVFRNNFEHYIPTSWYIELHEFPLITIDVLKVIKFLALEAGNYTHLTKTQKRRIKSVVYQCTRQLKSSILYKEIKK